MAGPARRAWRLATFSLCVALAQALEPAVVEELQTLGVRDTTCMAPWDAVSLGRHRWIDDGGDVRDLDAQNKAMGRFADIDIRLFARVAVRPPISTSRTRLRRHP